MAFTFDKDFRVEEILWKSRPATSPLSGREIGCVVGLDNKGTYRGGMEVCRVKGKGERSLYEMGGRGLQ